MIILLPMFIDGMINQAYSLQVADILKDRTSWYRDSQAVDIMIVLPNTNGGTIELQYMQVKQLKLNMHEC
jgi:hypothetical protein